jgi:hypothetical protein
VKEALDGSTSHNTQNPSLIYINIRLNDINTKAMVDTGATRSLITQQTLNKLRHYQQLNSTTLLGQLGDGHTTIQILGEVKLTLHINYLITNLNVLIVKTLNTDFILGGDWCRQQRVTIDYDTHRVYIRTSQGTTSVPYAKHLDHLSLNVQLVNSVRIPSRHEVIVQAKVPLSSAQSVRFQPAMSLQLEKSLALSASLLSINNYTTFLKIYNPGDCACTLHINTILGCISHQSPNTPSFNPFAATDPQQFSATIRPLLGSIQYPVSPTIAADLIPQLISHIANVQHRHAIQNILLSHHRIFDISKQTQATTTIHHTINTGDHLPIASRPYPKTVQQRREMQSEIQHMLNVGQIRPSVSPWSSPVIIQKKKDGGLRFLVDYRKLNAVTKKDCYPQPRTEELLNRLGGHRYFTKLDLKSGYFQIRIQEADKEKTAFITQDGLWEFNVLPQGVTNGPPTFQRVMNNLIGTGRWDFVVVYLDDIVIFSHTFDEHRKHLNEILTILDQAHFQINPGKCTIAANEIEFLSHTITEHSITPSADKIRAIIALPPPKTLKQANEFIGKINWYRKFIPNYSQIAAPIHLVTNKTTQRKHEFFWGPDQERAFEAFKLTLTTSPLFLQYPDVTCPFILSTDASLVGLGGILRQETASGTKINYYKSRMLTDTEKRYHPFELEALAIYWCITELRDYLGSSDFTIEIDHKPLVNLHKQNLDNKRVMNWIFKLQDIIPQILEIKYVKGKFNGGPDYLSRHFPNIQPPSIAEEPLFLSTKVANISFQPFVPHRSPVSDMLTAVTTRQQAKSTATTTPQPTSIPPTSPSVSIGQPPVVPPRKFDFSFQTIYAAQQADPRIQEKLRQVTTHPNRHAFDIKDGLLYKLLPLSHNGRNGKVPYLPSSMLNDVLFAYHDHPFSAHFGIQRTWHAIKQQYWWPNMYDTIVNYVNSCDKCAQHNIRRSKPPGHLKHLEPPHNVFEIIHMDFWGPVHPSATGNRYVVVLTDNLSKYVIAKPLPNNTAQSTARFLMEDFILIHGAPQRLITDLGVHFDNELLQALTTMTGIEHAFSTSYHPQTNGQVERFNATFCAQLAKYHDENSNNWDEYLQSIVFAYNNGLHSSTGFTPYELAFGRKQTSPFEPPRSTIQFRKPHDYWAILTQYKQTAITQARANIRHHQHLAKRRYDRGRTDPMYSIGDLVWVKVYTGRSKLDERYAGPFTVTALQGDQTYLVEDKQHSLRDWAHVNQLRPVYQR